MMEKPPQGSAEPKPIMMDKKILWAVQDDMAARLYTVGQIVSIETLNLYINRVATYLINPAVKGLTCWLDASSPISKCICPRRFPINYTVQKYSQSFAAEGFMVR